MKSGIPAPLSVYRALLRRLGPQGWWPVSGARGPAPRYRPGRFAAASEREAFEICAGAILTQNAAWANAVRAVRALREADVLDPRALLRTRRGRLERLVRPSGYFAQKAEKLRVFSRFVLGLDRPLVRWLRERPLDPARKELLSLWGIGPETADSMLLYAGGREIFVVDAYTLRAGRRLGWYGEAAGYDRAQVFLTARLPRGAPVYNEFHALLVALGKDFCRKRPSRCECPSCPLKGRCRAARRRGL